LRVKAEIVMNEAKRRMIGHRIMPHEVALAASRPGDDLACLSSAGLPGPRPPDRSPGIPPAPPPGPPAPPVEEPVPWRLPDEAPVPNPDENDSPPQHAHE
jgi:hypothetical protein